MQTPQDIETVKFMANVWRMNDERNKRIESEKKRLQELDDIALINEGNYGE